MPHQPRPVSPVALEQCSLPVTISDSDPYELLGSDDEFDDLTRAKKRRRIERLAECYLRGSSLFISTARLRGPFEDGWKNPWRKERKIVHKSDPQSSMKMLEARDEESPAQVQGSNPNPACNTNELHPAFFARHVSVSVRETASPQQSKFAGSRPLGALRSPSGARDGLGVPPKLKHVSSPAPNHTIIETGSIDWLRKDKKRMNFTSFEPPTSPTPTNGHRRIAEHQSRGSGSHSVAPVSSRGSSAEPTSNNLASTREQNIKSSLFIASPRHVPASPSRVPSRSPAISNPSPITGFGSPERNEQPASLRVISSTSQLSRFEYKRLRLPFSSPQLKLQSLPAQENSPADNVPSADPDARKDTSESSPNLDIETGVDQVNQGEIGMTTENDAMNLAEGDEKQSPPVNLSKSLRFADDTAAPSFKDPDSAPLTENDTYEELPSAQKIADPPGVSDRVPSLHSTAMPKENSNVGADTSPDTQLSTQAALLHAQKSFQDDLESPAHEYGITPAQQRGMDVGEESLLAHETPLFRPDTSERSLRRSLRNSEARKIQATSTQCMIDAATPYTFSTGKKPIAFRSISPQKADITKPRAIHTAQFPESSSPLPEDGHAFQARYESPSPDCVAAGQPPDHHTHMNRPNMQENSLPFALSGSTPTTAQDGQGGLQMGDSFNLSQAIADAGSWLQQSFDFIKDTRRSSLNEQVPP